MFWIGDSYWGWRYNIPKIPGEIIQGVVDKIPICCVVYYTLVKIICLLIYGPRRFTHKSRDSLIFTVFYDVERNENGNIHSKSFGELDYWQCPLCRITQRKSKLDWTTGTGWDYSHFRVGL